MNKLYRFCSRFWGRVYGAYPDFERNPNTYGGKKSAHLESVWTYPDHFAHNNYQYGHLPQICIIASGWKARVLALLFWPSSPLPPEVKFVIWEKNGDHPYDDVWRPYEDTGKMPNVPREGAVVRYYRHPSVDGNSKCNQCGDIMNNHGWIDSGGDGTTVCPGSKIYY
jgi:hypothetical protein